MDTLVLFSGGVDSAVLVAKTIAEGRLGAALHVSYSHPAQWSEAHAVAAIRLAYSKRGVLLPLQTVAVDIAASQLDAGTGAAGPRVVPGRNACLLSVATNVAASLGLSRVVFGATAEDLAEYADCRPEFVAAMSALASVWGVAIEAPLLGLHRADVLAMGKALDAPLDKAWSCYQPQDGKPCGKCGSCGQGAGAK